MPAQLIPGYETGTIAVIGFNETLPGVKLDLQPVQSSRIAAYAYDEATMLLFIGFPNGNVYEYQAVEPDTWEGFSEAQSKGSFFNQRIGGARGKPIYRYRKVEARYTPPTAEEISGGVVDAEFHVSPRGESMEPVTIADSIADLPTKDEELPTRALTVQQQASALAISNPEMYTRATNFLTLIRAERKLVEARALAFYTPAHQAYVAARQLRDEALTPYEEAEKIVKKAMLGFQQAEERQRRETEAKIRREAEEKARAEAEERSREDARRAAEHFEAQGEPELAAQTLANPLPVAPLPIAPVVLQSAVPQTKGVTRRENWQYRIVDQSAIPLSHEFYTLDLTKISARVKKLKQHANIPGVEAYDEGTIAVR